MATLTGKVRKTSYGGILIVSDDNTGITSTLKTVYSGSGNATPLQLSTTTIAFSGLFEFNGVTVNSIAPGDASYIVKTANGVLSNEFALSTLGSGFVKVTTGTGDLSSVSTVSTAEIGDDQVTYAKIQNVSDTDKVLGRSTAGAGDIEEITCTAYARSLLDDANASAARTTLGTVIGTDVQAYDATLQSLSSLGTAAGKYAYTTGVDTWAEGSITSFARTILDDADAATVRTTISAQQSNATLTSIAALGTAANRYAYTTDVDTWTEGTITSFARTILDDADAGTVRTTIAAQASDATLTALAAYNTNGVICQTAADTFAGRTITGTANRTTITDGNGVSGNPTIDIHASYIGQASITTLGTITTGTWTGTTIAVANGGTGVTSNTAYAVLCGGTTGTGAIQSIASIGTSGQILTSNGAGALPTFQAPPSGTALTKIQTQTASASATIDFTNITGHTNYIIYVNDLLPATDNVTLSVRISTDAGGTWKSGATDYHYQLLSISNTSTGAAQSTGASDFTTSLGWSNTAARSGGGILQVIAPGDGNGFTTMIWDSHYMDNSGNMRKYQSAGRYTQNTAVTGVRFYFSSGNITTGTFVLYGVA
jgi:hypothetical protein